MKRTSPDGTETWVGFNPKLNGEINNAWREGNASYQYMKQVWQYTIDLVACRQTTDDSGTIRPLRICPVEDAKQRSKRPRLTNVNEEVSDEAFNLC